MYSFESFKELVSQSNQIVAFTGAGISSESGIPTYRGDDGVWHKYDPSKYANINNFMKDPSYYWSFYRDVRYPALKDAKPNFGHIALAKLEEAGKLSSVITQNIDGLHQEAGSKRVIELHGNTRRILCLDCSEQYTMKEVYIKIQKKLPPSCTKCGGIIKPDVIFFGESLVSSVLESAISEARSCDMLIVIGSSLVVQPAASLPLMAKENGASLVIINKDPTPFDSSADLVFNTSASEVLKEVVG